jgi:hypothetical protein
MTTSTSPSLLRPSDGRVGLLLFVLVVVAGASAASATELSTPTLCSPPKTEPLRPALRPTLTTSDVQPFEVGVLGEMPVHDGLAVLGELYVGAGRGSQYRGGLWLGVRGDGPVWFEGDAGVSLVQALTKEARGEGRVSLIDFETDLLTQLRGVVGVQLWPRLAPWIGVTINYEVSFGPNEMLQPTYFPVPLVFTDTELRGGHQIWPGITGGVRF